MRHAYMHAYTYMQTKHTRKNAYTQTKHTYTHADKTHIHTYKQTHIHAFTHAHTPLKEQGGER